MSIQAEALPQTASSYMTGSSGEEQIRSAQAWFDSPLPQLRAGGSLRELPVIRLGDRLTRTLVQIFNAASSLAKVAYILCRYVPLLGFPVNIWGQVIDHDHDTCVRAHFGFNPMTHSAYRLDRREYSEHRCSWSWDTLVFRPRLALSRTHLYTAQNATASCTCSTACPPLEHSITG